MHLFFLLNIIKYTNIQHRNSCCNKTAAEKSTLPLHWWYRLKIRPEFGETANLSPWDSDVIVCIAKHLTKRVCCVGYFSSSMVFFRSLCCFCCIFAARVNSLVVSSLIHTFQVFENGSACARKALKVTLTALLVWSGQIRSRSQTWWWG